MGQCKGNYFADFTVFSWTLPDIGAINRRSNITFYFPEYLAYSYHVSEQFCLG